MLTLSHQLVSSVGTFSGRNRKDEGETLILAEPGGKIICPFASQSMNFPLYPTTCHRLFRVENKEEVKGQRSSDQLVYREMGVNKKAFTMQVSFSFFSKETEHVA